MGQPVAIKGIREGLLITLGDGSYEDVLHQLSLELLRKRAFIQGSRMVLQLYERPLLRHQLAELQELFEQHELTLWTVLTEQPSTRAAARELGLATRLAGSQTDLDGNVLPKGQTDNRSLAGTSPSNPNEVDQSGLFLKETLRSGRSVYHEGPIIIIGDVNPGAEIIAGGDVIVWGRLRGLVHAGAMGDETSIICALELNPTQLRIADQIAIPPEETGQKPVPEQAFIRSNQIVAEPW